MTQQTHSHSADFNNDVQHIIEDIHPESVLLIGCDSPPFSEQFNVQGKIKTIKCIAQVKGYHDLDQEAQYDVVVILPALDALNKRDAELYIGRLRSLHCKRMLVATQRADWQDKEFYAMAMSRLNHYPTELGPDIQLYEYNIHSYKSVPDWLNNKFWANPEMWNKYHW